MTHDKTLILAHLASRFTNRTEDLAVEALAFILSRSAIARSVLRDTLRAGSADDIDELDTIKTQMSTNGARPDLVGFGKNREERLLIEAKF